MYIYHTVLWTRQMFDDGRLPRRGDNYNYHTRNRHSCLSFAYGFNFLKTRAGRQFTEGMPNEIVKEKVFKHLKYKVKSQLINPLYKLDEL